MNQLPQNSKICHMYISEGPWYLVSLVTQPSGNLGSGGKALNPTSGLSGVIRGEMHLYLYLSFTSLRLSILL